MNENKILGSNRLPGSEKLTRPEEIKSMSKYLKAIRETYEENTKLDTNLDGIPGKTTGRIPEISELPSISTKAPGSFPEVALSDYLDPIQTPENTNPEVLELYEDIIGLDVSTKEITNLEGTRIDLEDKRDDISLSSEKIGLDSKDKDIKLPISFLSLEDTRQVELEKNKINLDLSDSERDIALSVYKELLEKSDQDTTIDLSNVKINLEDNIREPVLDDTKINLEDTRENSLENTRLDIDSPKEIGLSEYVDPLQLNEKNQTLEDNKILLEKNRNSEITNLSEFVSELEHESTWNNSLSNKRIDLIDNQQETELEDTRLDLEDIHENILEDTRLDLDDPRENNLEDTRLDLEDHRENELEDERLDLEDPRQNELENFIDLLDDPRDNELLEEYKSIPLSETNNENLSLGETIIPVVEEIPEISKLPNTTLELEDVSDIKELSNTTIDLSVNNDTTKLEDTRLDIVVPDATLKDDIIPLLENLHGEPEELYVDSLSVPESENPGSDGDESLEDTRIDIEDSREYELPENSLGLPPSGKNGEGNEIEVQELSSGIVRLEGVEGVSGLEQDRLDLNDPRENTLEDFIDSLNDPRENELENTRLDLNDPRENELEDTRLDLDDPRENELEDERLDLEDPRENELEDERLDLEDPRENELEDFRDDIKIDPKKKEIELEDTRIPWRGLKKGKDNPDPKLEDEKIPLEMNQNGEPEGLYDDFLSIPVVESSAEGNNVSLEDTIIKNPNDLNPIQSSREKPKEPPTNLEEYIQTLSDDEAYSEALKVATEGKNASPEMSNWFSKISSLVSAYFSSPQMSPQRAFDYMSKISSDLKKLRDSFNPNADRDDTGKIYYDVPGYQLAKGGSILTDLNLNNYVRWLAENSISRELPPQIRRILLDETLAAIILAREKAEKLAKSNRDRLPGNNSEFVSSMIRSGVSGTIDSLLLPKLEESASQLFSGASGINTTNPMNRPETNINGQLKEKGIGITKFERANDRDPESLLINSMNGDLKKLATKKILKNSSSNTVSLYNSYIGAKSFGKTLKDLCPGITVDDNTTLDDLKTILESSPYITTPSKFGTIMKGRYLTQTLDMNTYWEVIMNPFVNQDMNGGWSYLPAFWEINLENIVDHNYPTNYSSWIPINSFELQKSKTTSKQLSLYDGEIYYPVGTEFLNELRLTIADDSFKSWRRYFEKCMKVAVYNSYAHDKDYYETEGTIPTAIDESNFCIALYKNITFEFEIYIMNPQYNQIKKYHLLGVLKDFTEESIGEIDSGGTDLTVSFSIVGENPDLVNNKELNQKEKPSIKSNFDQLKNQKKKNSSNSNLIKLL